MNAQPEEAITHKTSASDVADNKAATHDAASPLPNGAVADRTLVIRGDNDRGLPLSERLIRAVYRLTWRTPLYNLPQKLRLKQAEPLRLLMVPADPIQGNAARGMAIRTGHFDVLGVKQPIKNYDFDTTALPGAVQGYLHSFEWLRDLAAAARRDQVRPIAEKLVQQWLASHEEGRDGAAWRPDIAARRLIHCATFAPLIMGGPDRTHRTRVLTHMAQTARYLDRNAHKAERGIQRLTAWAGVVAASLLLPDGHARRVYGEAGLRRAMLTTLGADGGVFSRAPMEQFQAIALLSILRALYHESEDDSPPMAIDNALDMAVAAFQAVTHDDGGMAGWQGAPALNAEQVNHVIAASGVIARPLRKAGYWGYQRLTAGRTVLLADAGPPPVARHAATGCASTLAFELSSQGQRIIASCGGAACEGGVITPDLAQGLRATAAHSTLSLNDRNSTAILPNGQLGDGVNEVETQRREVDQATRLEMSHDGYVQRFGLLHRRIIQLGFDGAMVSGEDILEPAEHKRRGQKPDFDSADMAIRFHLGHRVEAHESDGGTGALLRLADGQLWELSAAHGALSIEDSLWVDGDGQPKATKQIVISDAIGPEGGTFGWTIRKMG